MARRTPKQYDDDDGRTIANMNVEGMRWYKPENTPRSREEARAELQRKIDQGEVLSRREAIRYTWYAILAGLAVVGFVGGGTVLFIFILWLLMK